ncbi:GRP family sugar transporter [Vibrio hannami]|nr:GRP family sugar transporter [Vibrio hannami]MDG3086628.1 GRP family sugar transporter [Vibrio hannami]
MSGVFWALGQTNQLKSIQLIGVSKTMPISTGLQLVSTSLFGVLVFHEWATTISIVLGVLALIFIIAGVVLTSLEDRRQKSEEKNGDMKKGIIILLISTLGYLVLIVVARFFHVSG